MALVDAEVFEEKEVSRVYLAGRLREAKAVERTLSENNVDYVIEIESFKKYLFGILPAAYQGVAFYVLSVYSDSCRQILTDAGLTKGLVYE